MRPLAPAFAFALSALSLAGCLGLEEQDDRRDDLRGAGVSPPGDEPVNATFHWAAPDEATIRPGVKVRSEAGQCTTNFVFTSPNGTVYVGFAAHCVGGGAATDTNGCDPAVEPRPLGYELQVDGASQPAKLAYTSWGTMQAAQEGDEDTCDYNDFAVAALAPEDRAKVSPAMLHYGGPGGVAPAGDVQPGMKILSYGNSGLRPAALEPQLSPKEGYVIGVEGGGWSATVCMLTPGVPGDSGSGVMLSDGRALGIAVTLGLSQDGLVNGVSSLEKALAYAKEKGSLDLGLATWEQAAGGTLPDSNPGLGVACL